MTKHYVKTQSPANLRERLKQGALAVAKLNLEIAVDQEAWQRLFEQPPAVHGAHLVQDADGKRRSAAPQSCDPIVLSQFLDTTLVQLADAMELHQIRRPRTPDGLASDKDHGVAFL